MATLRSLLRVASRGTRQQQQQQQRWQLQPQCAASPHRSLSSLHYRSPIPDVQIPDSVGYQDFVLQRCEQLDTNTALLCASSGRRITYRQLATGTRSVASGLAKLGFSHRDVMCVFSHNCIEYPVAMYAGMAAGGVVTTANPEYTAGELAAQLRDSGSKFLFTTKDKLEVAAEAAKASGVVRELILFDERVAGTRCFGDLLEDDGSSDPRGSYDFDQNKDLAAILYSSGTTGVPKGVMLSHRNLVANVLQCLQLTVQQRSQRLLGVLPFFHVYGQVPVLAFTFWTGNQISVMRRFDPTLFMETLQDHQLTWVHVVPPIVLFMAMHPMATKYDLSSLHTLTSAAAPLRSETEEAFRKRFPHVDITQGWGMTEISPVGALMPPLDSKWRQRKPGSCGILVPNQEARIVDPESGRLLGCNSSGELQLRGDNVMLGYFSNEAATADSFTDDGWFRTGDVCHFDEDGYLFVTDRIKELIKVKGLQVAPAELEALLLECPDVVDAGVVSRPDDRAGELPVAFVVRRPGSEASEAAIADWLAQRVAPHKRLEGGVRFVQAVPRALSGKILRRQLRMMLDEEADVSDAEAELS